MHLSLPLLHIAQAATHVTTAVDGRVVLLAVVLLAIAIACIWAPRSMSFTRLTRAPATRAVMASLVLFAVLPSVVPYDHLLPALHHDDGVAAEEAHATHCHLTPGSCADAPLTAGPNQLIFNAPLVVAPVLFAVLVMLALPVLTGISLKPAVRPPVTS